MYQNSPNYKDTSLQTPPPTDRLWTKAQYVLSPCVYLANALKKKIYSDTNNLASLSFSNPNILFSNVSDSELLSFAKAF